ncbi:MAG: spermidine synthase [Gemmatimonadota bacterium]
MKPVETLATTTAPDGAVVTLYRHDGAYLMVVDGVELMSTRRTHSEVQLAALACAALKDKATVSVLIGGLGFGATLRAALDLLAADARVVVAEIMQEVIDWNLRPDWALAGDAMSDPRVVMRRADVIDVLRENVGAFDAIMLDVDNGAESFTTGSNKKLYGEKGIRQAAAALKPGGTLAYWSVDSENAFVRALKREGLTTAVHKARSHATSGGYNCIILARPS